MNWKCRAGKEKDCDCMEDRVIRNDNPFEEEWFDALQEVFKAMDDKASDTKNESPTAECDMNAPSEIL